MGGGGDRDKTHLRSLSLLFNSCLDCLFPSICFLFHLFLVRALQKSGLVTPCLTYPQPYSHSTHLQVFNKLLCSFSLALHSLRQSFPTTFSFGLRQYETHTQAHNSCIHTHTHTHTHTPHTHTHNVFQT